MSSEAFMKGIDRRRFVAGIAASSLPSLDFQLSTYALADDSQLTSDRHLPHGCIFAREERQKSIASNISQAHSIDFWTFRVSEIESATLPDNVSRVVIWDDVFSSGNVIKDFES